MKSASHHRFSLLVFAGVLTAAVPAAQAAGVPPNAAGRVQVEGTAIRLAYAGETIFDGTIENAGSSLETRTRIFQAGEKIEQVVYMFGGADGPIRLTGKIRASEEAFPCEVDRRDRRGSGPLMVRHVSGLSRSLLNRAVYDRRSDWVLSVDPTAKATIRPAAADGGTLTFDLEAEGGEIVLRFRPRYYNKHRGLVFLRALDLLRRGKNPWPAGSRGSPFLTGSRSRMSSKRPRPSPPP